MVTKEELKQYSNLVDMNQGLKNICSIYYISKTSNVIFAKSLIPFIELSIELNPDVNIDLFRGCIILPNKLFEFKKEAKKKNLTINITSEGVCLGQDNSKEKVTLAVQPYGEDLTDELEKEYLNTTIIPEMYTKYMEILPTCSGALARYELTEDEVISLVNCAMLEVEVATTAVRLTKQLFLDIKKTDRISVEVMDTNYNPMKDYIMINHETAYYTSHIILAQKMLV